MAESRKRAVEATHESKRPRGKEPVDEATTPAAGCLPPPSEVIKNLDEEDAEMRKLATFYVDDAWKDIEWSRRRDDSIHTSVYLISNLGFNAEAWARLRPILRAECARRAPGYFVRIRLVSIDASLYKEYMADISSRHMGGKKPRVAARFLGD